MTLEPSHNNCSQELREATRAVEWWGRSIWPTARVIHELKVGAGRADMAFVTRKALITVEIKAKKDTLTNLKAQLKNLRRTSQEVWFAYDERFQKAIHEDWLAGRALVPLGTGYLKIVGNTIARASNEGAISPVNQKPAFHNRKLTTPMLELLWRAEALALATRHKVSMRRDITLYDALPLLARALTGDQVVEGVCACLRSRPTRWPADPPLPWS